MLWNKNIFMSTSSYVGFNQLDYFVPLIRYYGKNTAKEIIVEMDEKDNCKLPTRQFGFRAQNKKWSDDFEKAKRTSEFYEASLHSESIFLFERFIEECQDKGIQLIFVYSPEFIEGQEYTKNRKDIIDIFIKYSKKYNITYLDYSKDSISYEKRYFYNATHLNADGALIFSEQFANDLQLLIQN
jgi:hypothetical protein